MAELVKPDLGGIERHAFIPCDEGVPPLVTHIQQDRVIGERFAIIPLENRRTQYRLRADTEAQAIANIREAYRSKIPECIPVSLYDFSALPVDGEYVPSISVNATVACRLAVRLRYAVWEAGGMQPGRNGVGAAQVITNTGGYRLVPAIVRTRGRLANCRHAAFSIYPQTNLVIVQAFVTRDTQVVRIGRIRWDDPARLPVIEPVWEGEDHHSAPARFYEAVCTALDKANTVSCREAMFVRHKKRRDAA